MKLLIRGLFVSLLFLTACTHHSQPPRGGATTATTVGSDTGSSSQAVTNLGGFKLVEQGRHYRVWERPASTTNVTRGSLRQRLNRPARITELATGLNYLRNGNWINADPTIRAVGGGASATNAGHNIFLSSNPNVVNALNLTSRDGKSFASHVLGLSFFDLASGSNVFVATLQDSTGRVLSHRIGSNDVADAVLYTNALAGACGRADLVYVNKRSGLEQFVLFRRQLARTPEDFGLNSDSTIVQLWSEFTTAPNPAIRRMPDDGTIPDQQLDFGAMRIRSGTAFLVGDSGRPSEFTHVSTSWTNIGNRTFLIERVPFRAIARQLVGLPASASVETTPSNVTASVLPPQPRTTFTASTSTRPPMQTLAYDWRESTALAWDYSILDGGYSNHVFKADETYLVSNDVFLTGKTVIEGGAVIKYTANSQTMYVDDAIECRTSPWHPAIFTACDDDSVGVKFPLSTGSPSGYYPYIALFINGITNQLSNLRFCYSTVGLVWEVPPTETTFRDSQFVGCSWPIAAESCVINLQNILFWYADAAITGSMADFRGQNLTFDTCGELTYDYYMETCILNLTNSLVIAVTNWGNFSEFNTNCVALESDPANVFQTVGGGYHYLRDGSPYRGAGTTNIPPSLLSALRNKTTAPPVVLANQSLAASDVNFSPQAQRMTQGVDLGYAYDPVDWALANVVVTNPITVSVAPGTVIAGFGTNGIGRSLTIANGASFTSLGTADDPVRILPYNLVQEFQGNGWSSPFYAIVTDDIYENGYPPPAAAFNCRFSEFSSFMMDITTLGLLTSSLTIRDCQFNGGQVVGYSGFSATNCLFNRTLTWAVPLGTATGKLQNNLFYGGTVFAYSDSGNAETFSDNLFDHTDVEFNDFTYAGGYNAYISSTPAFSRLMPTNATDLVISNSNYVTGLLGRFYYPTNGANLSTLINAGSVTNAGLVGLYHFTTTTNLISGAQIKDAATRLDIGFHFAATDVAGKPLDSDGDGVPDFVEDANGNGSPSDDAQSWQVYNSTNALTTGHGLEVFTPLR